MNARPAVRCPQQLKLGSSAYRISRPQVTQPLPPVIDAQSNRLGFIKDPLAQRLDLDRIFLVFLSSNLLAGTGNRLKRPTDKMDRALHVGSILERVP
jgi:hypothetical protein